MSASTEIAPDAAGLRVARVDLAAALRAAAMHGYNEGIDNHFSLAVPGRDDRFLLNRYGPHWSELRASDILTIDLDGNVVDGEGEWETSAFMIHRGVHQSRAPRPLRAAHAHAVRDRHLAHDRRLRHAHLSQNSMYFHGHVVSLEYGGLADAAEEGLRIGDAVGDDINIVIMENHGVLVIGHDVADAWHKLYFLERAARSRCSRSPPGRSCASPRTSRRTPRRSSARVGGQSELFAAVRRELDRVNPGYER